ncbi:helix-turn-helix domain-containing protein, partial [Salmonella enterica]|uniref:helix-turn-helix domain-containing protein n=1 Tax=Salmonella enterica TaxID=28901 RepID=UPI003FA6D4D3
QVEAELPGRPVLAIAERAPADAESLGGSTLRELEEAHIRAAVRRNRGNLRRASKELGISRSTLYRKVERYQLEDVVRSSNDGDH